jgi:hypothetical protein
MRILNVQKQMKKMPNPPESLASADCGPAAATTTTFTLILTRIFLIPVLGGWLQKVPYRHDFFLFFARILTIFS